MNSDEGPPAPISEVGCNGLQNESKQPDKVNAERLLCNMEILLTRVLAAQQTPTVSTNQMQLLKFDPDESDSDINEWCKVTEVIVQHKCLEGVNLLVALTGALKGRVATCLAKLNLNEITWNSVKEILIARFAKPKLVQDYFDDILRFQIDVKETASESALRLWNLIERTPKTRMPEEVITGFVISLLCQKDNLIRRELYAQTVTSRAQLFRILGRISLKQHGLDTEVQEPEGKQVEARFRKQRDDVGTKSQDYSSSSCIREKTADVISDTNSQPGHVATTFTNKKSCSEAAVSTAISGIL